MPPDEIVQVCPDDGLHRCRYCGEYFDRPYNTGFTDETERHHYITGSAGILSGEQRYQSDGRRVRAGSKPSVAEVEAPEKLTTDEEMQSPIATDSSGKRKSTELSEHETALARNRNFSLGLVHGPVKNITDESNCFRLNRGRKVDAETRITSISGTLKTYAGKPAKI